MIIVFIEDNDDDAWLLKRAWEKAGIPDGLRFLPSGQKAVEFITSQLDQVASSNLPESILIFLDINMPGMNGFEFLKWLRAQPKLNRVPAVMLTTSENPSDIKMAYNLGANAYLVKSNTLTGLSEMLTAAYTFWIKFNRFDLR